ncbi:MAG: META domain-containing protein [Thermoplasmata archaeon]
MARVTSPLVAAWRLLTFDPGTDSLDPPLQGTELTAEFHEDGRLAGSAGCNHYGTTYALTDASIAVNPRFAVTQMWCGDPEGAMAQEDAFLRAWSRVAAYRLRQDQLELLDAEGATVFFFVSAEPSEPSR